MTYVKSSLDGWKSLEAEISYEQEEVWCLALNSECRLLGKTMLFRGTVDSCPFHVRDLFRFLISLNSNQFLMAHSHPSSNPSPSPQDFETTNRLMSLSQMMEFHFLDHLILARQSYFSFAESGLLNLSQLKLTI